MKKISLLVTATLVLGVAACGDSSDSGDDGNADSNAFPEKPVTLIVPFAAGGTSDISARAYAKCMSDELGQPIVVENKDGASGALGITELKNSEPDGYTIGLVSIGSLVVTPVFGDADYSHTDFSPIAALNQIPTFLLVLDESPFKTAEDFLESKERIVVGGSGTTTPQVIEMQRLQDEYDVDLDMQLVPFDGGNSEVLAALMGKNIDAALAAGSADVVARLDDGSFRALWASPEKRVAAYPDVPTLAELGYDTLTLGGVLLGLAGPKGVPEDARATLEDSVEACFTNDEVIETVGEVGRLPEFTDGKTFGDKLEEAFQVYQEVVARKAG